MSFISLKLQENDLPVQLLQLSKTRRPQRCRHLHVMADPVQGGASRLGKIPRCVGVTWITPIPGQQVVCIQWEFPLKNDHPKRCWRDSLLTIMFQGRAVKLRGCRPFPGFCGWNVLGFLGEWWWKSSRIKDENENRAKKEKIIFNPAVAVVSCGGSAHSRETCDIPVPWPFINAW